MRKTALALLETLAMDRLVGADDLDDAQTHLGLGREVTPLQARGLTGVHGIDDDRPPGEQLGASRLFGDEIRREPPVGWSASIPPARRIADSIGSTDTTVAPRRAPTISPIVDFPAPGSPAMTMSWVMLRSPN